MILSKVFQKFTPGFKVTDYFICLESKTIKIELEKEDQTSFCRRCGEELSHKRGRHRLKLKTLSVMGMTTYLCLWREKRHCNGCNKARSEAIEFVSNESPHMTTDYSFFVGELCEISSVSKVADLLDLDGYSTWRSDFKRMKNYFKTYKIPNVRRLSVDEVYVRKKAKYKGENRSKRFMTVVSCLDRKKVLWVSEGRSKEALDEFFKEIGTKACRQIEVVAGDQFEGFRRSVKEHCPKAKYVFDRFHLMQNFNVAFNEQRKSLYSAMKKDKSVDPELKKLVSGKYRYLFLKRDSRRTESESEHIIRVLDSNQDFVHMEIIKEKMKVFFDCDNEDEAFLELSEIRKWCNLLGFDKLLKWHINLTENWDTLKNYYTFKVTSALSEGMNNVIKTTIKKAYGYKNMDYLKLKIMQQCGLLNSKYFDKDYNFRAQGYQ